MNAIGVQDGAPSNKQRAAFARRHPHADVEATVVHQGEEQQRPLCEGVTSVGVDAFLHLIRRHL